MYRIPEGDYQIVGVAWIGCAHDTITNVPRWGLTISIYGGGELD
jgi:hypothetical protein